MKSVFSVSPTRKKVTDYETIPVSTYCFSIISFLILYSCFFR